MQDELMPSYLRIQDILNGAEVTDIYEIEQILLFIKTEEEKIEHLKNLKKKRNEQLDFVSNTHQANIDNLKKSIISCMKSKKKKSADFPGVGKVSLKNLKGKWTVLDEEKLNKHLENLGVLDQVSEKVLKVNKTKLNSLLDDLELNSNTSEFAKREEARDSLSISLEESSDQIEVPVILRNVNQKSEEYDKIEI